jgi:hypothetical protein
MGFSFLTKHYSTLNISRHLHLSRLHSMHRVVGEADIQEVEAKVLSFLLLYYLLQFKAELGHILLLREVPILLTILSQEFLDRNFHLMAEAHPPSHHQETNLYVKCARRGVMRHLTVGIGLTILCIPLHLKRSSTLPSLLRMKDGFLIPAPLTISPLT